MKWVKIIFQLALLLALQVFLLDHIQLFGLCHPYVFIVILLIMPITLPAPADMLIGAGTGLIMDICANSLGVHMAACVALMYIRRLLIPRFVSEPDRMNNTFTPASMGSASFIKYAVILTTMYHAIVGLVGSWNFAHTGWMLLQILVSSIVAFALILLYGRIIDQ